VRLRTRFICCTHTPRTEPPPRHSPLSSPQPAPTSPYCVATPPHTPPPPTPHPPNAHSPPPVTRPSHTSHPPLARARPTRPSDTAEPAPRLPTHPDRRPSRYVLWLRLLLSESRGCLLFSARFPAPPRDLTAPHAPPHPHPPPPNTATRNAAQRVSPPASGVVRRVVRSPAPPAARPLSAPWSEVVCREPSDGARSVSDCVFKHIRMPSRCSWGRGAWRARCARGLLLWPPPQPSGLPKNTTDQQTLSGRFWICDLVVDQHPEK